MCLMTEVAVQVAQSLIVRLNGGEEVDDGRRCRVFSSSRKNSASSIRVKFLDRIEDVDRQETITRLKNIV